MTFSTVSYVVSDAPQRRVKFHGKAPFTLWHKAHLTAGLLAMLWFAFLLFQPSNTSASVSAALSTSRSSDISKDAPPRRNLYSQASTKVLAMHNSNANGVDSYRRKRLTSKGEHLKSELNFMPMWLKSSRDAIDADRQHLLDEQKDLISRKRKITLNRRSVDLGNPAAVTSFNMAVDEARQKMKDYNHNLQNLNTEVDHYNNVLHAAQFEEQQLTEIDRELKLGQQ